MLALLVRGIAAQGASSAHSRPPSMIALLEHMTNN